MAPSRARRRLPPVYIDEHLPPEIKAAFLQGGFPTVVEVARDRRFASRDEMDYLPALRKERAVFVTSDEAFLRELREKDIRHTGMVYIPKQMLRDEKELFAAFAAGYVRRSLEDGSMAMQDVIVYPGIDGFRVAGRRGEGMLASWEEIFRDLE